jgi:S-methylmethionine-dependent homocysteine/selenocysteine methylase
MERGGADAVLVNCAPPEDITKAIRRMKQFSKLPYGGFAHIGHFSPPSWKFEFFPQFVDTESWPPETYAIEAKHWTDAGATIIGGCCGTRPDHITALRLSLGEKKQKAGQA